MPSFAVDIAVRAHTSICQKVAGELADDLRALDSGVEWKTELAVDRLVAPPAQTTEILDAARRKLLDEDWDLAIVVTDLPLRVGRGPISQQVSPTHGIAVVSLPALGTLHLTHRLRRTFVELVGELVGDGRGQWNGDGAFARLKRRWGRSVLQELATETADRPGSLRFLFRTGGSCEPPSPPAGKVDTGVTAAEF